MIKPEQIPQEAVDAAIVKYAFEGRRGWNMFEVIAAAINAWPGAWGECDFASEWISLPLTEDNSDD